MKHLLNNISKEEKQSILEQHKGGMKIFNENFNNMVNKKLGHVELYEQLETSDDSSIFSTKKISDLSDRDKERLLSANSGVWDSLIGDTTFGGMSFGDDFMKSLLSDLSIFVVERALTMNSLTMDEAIERVLYQLPEYFKTEEFVKLKDNLKKNREYVQKILRDSRGLRLVKAVVEKNYNHNKVRTTAY
jgi:hypothetical protein